MRQHTGFERRLSLSQRRLTRRDFKMGHERPKHLSMENMYKAQLHFIEISGVSILFGEKLET